MVVSYERTGHVAYVTLDRPEKLNAVNPEVAAGLGEAWGEFRHDDEAWVAILSGSGRAFCAGIDVGSLAARATETGIGPFLDALPGGSIETDRYIFKPVIAAVHGYCLGVGLTLALACDIRVAAEGTRLGFPEVRRGIPTIIGAALAARVAGLGGALPILLTGDNVDAQEAYHAGLVTEVVTPDQVMARAEAWAQKVCEAAPLAVRMTKEVSVRALDAPFDHVWRLGEAMRRLASTTEDAAEGPRAWREKRQPNWQGR